MKYWTNQWLVRAAGQHIASGSGMRVQVLEVPENDTKPWPVRSGELLIICLAGSCEVEVNAARRTLGATDQILVERDEQFRVLRGQDGEPPIVQLIWAPGISGG